MTTWDWVWIVPVLIGTWLVIQWFAVAPPPTPTVAASQPQPQPQPTAPTVAASPQPSWCFVGENTLGRMCVESDHCGPLDRFATREACEYTEASALPLGITQEGGLYYHPFMRPREPHYHTF